MHPGHIEMHIVWSNPSRPTNLASIGQSGQELAPGLQDGNVLAKGSPQPGTPEAGRGGQDSGPEHPEREGAEMGKGCDRTD